VAEYLIAFNDEWLDGLTEDDFAQAGARVRTLRDEMNDAGVLVYTNGLANDRPVFSVDATSGEPAFSDGPFVETKEHLGGFAIVDVEDEAAARHWAAKVAVACGWPQEVHEFQRRGFRAGER
jgi:hypothetical protein